MGDCMHSQATHTTPKRMGLPRLCGCLPRATVGRDATGRAAIAGARCIRALSIILPGLLSGVEEGWQIVCGEGFDHSPFDV